MTDQVISPAYQSDDGYHYRLFGELGWQRSTDNTFQEFDWITPEPPEDVTRQFLADMAPIVHLEGVTDAWFTSHKNHAGIRGVIVPLSAVPETIHLTGKYPDRLMLEGWRGHYELRQGATERYVHVPENHYRIISRKLYDHRRRYPAFGVGFYKGQRTVAVRYTGPTGDAAPVDEQEWLSSGEIPRAVPPKIAPYSATFAGGHTGTKKRKPRDSRSAQVRPADTTAAGGGQSGTAVTKMSAEERQAYKERLLAKANPSPRDLRHLARIEKLEAK